MVEPTAQLEYDPALDRLVVAFGEAESVDLQEIGEDVWLEYDASSIGRCVRVTASGATIGRSGQWRRTLTEVVGPSVIAAWERERRKLGQIGSFSVQLGEDTLPLSWVWTTLHRSVLDDGGPAPQLTRIAASRGESLRSKVRAWLSQGLGFPSAALVPFATATRERAGAEGAPSVVNLRLAEELAALLGISPVSEVSIGPHGIEVEVAVDPDAAFLCDLAVEAVSPASAARRLMPSSRGYLSATLPLVGLAPADHLVLRFTAWEEPGVEPAG